MSHPHERRPAGCRDGVGALSTGPDPLMLDVPDDEPIDLQAMYETSVAGLDPQWLERYGEASWYAAITLFGLFPVPADYRPEDIPEEYRWPGPSRQGVANPEEPS